MYGEYELCRVLLRKLIKLTNYLWIRVLSPLFMFLWRSAVSYVELNNVPIVTKHPRKKFRTLFALRAWATCGKKSEKTKEDVLQKSSSIINVEALSMQTHTYKCLFTSKQVTLK